LRLGAFTKEEYDFVCDKARKAIILGHPKREFALAEAVARLRATKFIAYRGFGGEET
jgi:hypothetical protein